MRINITKVANVILYMLHKQVKSLNDKKIQAMLFLIDYNHLKFCGSKIFNEDYIKQNRHPEGKVLSEVFDIIANNDDLDENDEIFYLIQELFQYLDIEVIEQKSFIELKFIKTNEEFDDDIFSSDELKTIQKIINKHKNCSPRAVANATFQIEEVRVAKIGEIII